MAQRWLQPAEMVARKIPVVSLSSGKAPPADASNENDAAIAPDGRHSTERGSMLSLDSALALYAIVEVVLLAACLFIGSLIYPGLGNYTQPSTYLVVDLGWVITFALLARQAPRQRHIHSEYINTAARLRNWCFASLSALTIAFLLKISGDFSRIWFAMSFVSGMILVVLLSTITNRHLATLEKKHRVGSRVVVYGVSNRTPALLERFSGESGGGLYVDAVFDTRATRIPPSILNMPVSNGLDNLVAYIQKKRIDTVVVDLPLTAMDRINTIVRYLESVNVDIFLAPSDLQLLNSEYSINSLGRMPAISLFVRPMRGIEGAAKILMDYLGAGVAVILLLPVFAVAALAIKLDSPGPIFFRQPRCGMNNQKFMMYKFRSMRQDKLDVNANMLTLRSDPRVTRVGAFLRRTSIDELPQVLNVLKGEMSLVGPRPHAAGAKAGERLYPEVVARYAARHRVLPGITGLAQIRGHRGTTETEGDIIARVDSDLEYIRTWSLFLDIKIILITAFTFLWQKRAY